MARLGLATPLLGFRCVRIGEASRLAGRTIGETRVRMIIGVAVVGAFGAAGFVTNPGPDYRVDAGDLVAVVGERSQLAAVEREAASARLGAHPSE